MASAVAITLWLCACTGNMGSDPIGVVDDDGLGAHLPGTGLDGRPLAPGDGETAGQPAKGPSNTDTASTPMADALPSPTLRRLTRDQLDNALRDLLGPLDSPFDASALTPIPALSGLRAIGAASVAMPERDVEALEGLVDALAAQVFDAPARRSALVGCDPSAPGCIEGFIARFGRRAFRRPLSAQESARYAVLAADVRAATSDVWFGPRAVLSAMLQSPLFLYRAELGTPTTGSGDVRDLDPFELASRLSFFLWNSIPDDTLLDSAETGRLLEPAELQRQAERMLAAPQAADTIEAFFVDLLELDHLDELPKLTSVYPQASEALLAAMKAETLATARVLLLEQGLDYREAFTTERTLIGRELAALYGLPAASVAAEPREVSLAGAQGARAGLLTQASFLALHAHPGSSSATLRGKFIRQKLLCQAIPPPPPDVDTTLPDASTAPTARERLTRHREDPSCAGCHGLMDPIGLSLENFDGIGAFRMTENGAPIDASGELDGDTYGDARGLGQALAAHPDLPACMGRTMLRYARGALETRAEDARIKRLTDAFAADGHRLSGLMLAIAMDPSFRQVGALP